MNDEAKAMLAAICDPDQTDNPNQCLEDFFDLSPMCKARNCTLDSHWYTKFMDRDDAQQTAH